MSAVTVEPNAKELTLDAAREALELHVRGTRRFERSGAFHGVLRSFTEARATGTAHGPRPPPSGPVPSPVKR